jgi:hypothetical protein
MTESHPNRTAWSWPWGYFEAFVVAMALVVGGIMAQWLFGPLPTSFLAWPINGLIVVGLIIVSFLARLFHRQKVVIFLTSLPLSAALMVFLAIMALLMGLIPQTSPQAAVGPDPLSQLGLRKITSSWPFVVVYFLALVSLGATALVRFSRQRLVFFFNHFGLWLLLIAAGFGAADRQKEIMIVPKGAVEWRAHSEGRVKEMDLAIRLDDFQMEEYPARLVLVDSLTGQAWPPESNPALLPIETMPLVGRLADFEVKVIQFMTKAVPLGEGRYVRAIMAGAGQAAQVQVRNLKTLESFEGWLSSGSGYLPSQRLPLGSFVPGQGPGYLLAMTRPEPKLFLSKIKVYTKEGQEAESTVAVNRPLRVGDWLIYQRDYDVQAGPASRWSGFELVKDPWLPLAYAGFIIWSIGCLGLILQGGRQRRDLGLA